MGSRWEWDYMSTSKEESATTVVWVEINVRADM